MAKYDCKFTLKHPNSNTKSEIRLRISFNYVEFIWNIKDDLGRVLKIYPELWDKNNQYPIPKGKIPKKFQIETSNLQVIGNTIDSIKVYINEITNDCVSNKTNITKELLRTEILSKTGLTKKKKEINIFQFCEATIEQMENGLLLIENTKRYAKSTIDKYKYTAQILEVFNPNSTFSMIDKDWYNQYVQFLTLSQSVKYKNKNGEEKVFKKKDLQPASVGNYIKNLKFLMGYAIEKGISTNENHTKKWFTRPKEQKGYGNIHIALNEAELSEIYNFNITKAGFNRTYEKAKDMFLIGCYTGLRVSDFNSGLSAKDFTTIERNGKTERVLVLPTRKTGSVSYTPAIWLELQSIFEKYNYQLPLLADNTIRTYTQKICEKIAGFDETTSWSITVGGKTEKITKAKWKMVGNHTGRRSFITNLKSRGYSFDEIGQFTGQSTIAVIKEYDKTPKIESVLKIKEKYDKQR